MGKKSQKDQPGIWKKLKWSIAKAVDQPVSLVHLEHPESLKHGDYATNLAFKINQLDPYKNAQKLKQVLEKSREIGRLVDKIEAVKPGFINFYLKKDWLLKELRKTVEQKEAYGRSVGSFKKIMVEYAQPNTHKLFHIGHLRNIVNGEAVVRLLEAAGNQVVRVNYQGDVGLHIAKCLYILKKDPGFELEKIAEKPAVERVEVLARAYVKGNQAFKKVKKAKQAILRLNKKIYSQEDEKINRLWRTTRQWSLDYFEAIYKRLYTHFDRYYFESQVAKKGKELVSEGLKKGIFKKSQGAIIFPGSKYNLHDRVFITKEGNPTYEAKDMGLGWQQFKDYQPDLAIHNVSEEQTGYFQVVFKALAELLPETKGKEKHLVYGWVRLKDGKMSSRAGRVITARAILEEAKARIKKEFPKLDEKTLEKISVGAVKYSFLKVAPKTEVVFDFKESISLQGNSGPYLQYTYARCQSVLNQLKGGFEPVELKADRLVFNPEETALLRTFYRFPSLVNRAAQTYSPNLIAGFLYELAQEYNAFYNQHRILDQGQSRPLRLMLTAGIAQIIKNGLGFLGIKTPKKM